MTILEVFENEKLKKDLDKYITNIYTLSEKMVLVRQYMELEDFRQELYMYIIRYGNILCNDKPIGLAKWIVKKKALRISENLTRDKNRANNISSNESLDNPDSEVSNTLLSSAYTDFDEGRAIEHILQYIPPHDRDICRLFLMGYKQKEILNFCDYTPRQLQYRLRVIYKPLFIQGLEDYKEKLTS